MKNLAHNQHFKQIFWLSSLSIILTGTLINLNPLSAIAENNLSECQQPEGDEYLVLVITPTRNSQQQLKNRVSNQQSLVLCNYDGETVTRVGGFVQFNQAQQWATSITKDLELNAIVVKPANSPTVTTPNPPNPSNTTNTTNFPAFNPKPLGSGYAVLVDYFNQPSAATKVKQVTTQDVGLVSFQGRPYLLAIYTSDRTQGETMLNNLSNQGFWTIMVNSSQVTLLTAVVRY